MGFTDIFIYSIVCLERAWHSFHRQNLAYASSGCYSCNQWINQPIFSFIIMLQACLAHEIIDGPRFTAAIVRNTTLHMAIKQWFFNAIRIQVTPKSELYWGWYFVSRQRFEHGFLKSDVWSYAVCHVRTCDSYPPLILCADFATHKPRFSWEKCRWFGRVCLEWIRPTPSEHGLGCLFCWSLNRNVIWIATENL